MSSPDEGGNCTMKEFTKQITELTSQNGRLSDLVGGLENQKNLIDILLASEHARTNQKLNDWKTVILQIVQRQNNADLAKPVLDALHALLTGPKQTQIKEMLTDAEQVREIKHQMNEFTRQHPAAAYSPLHPRKTMLQVRIDMEKGLRETDLLKNRIERLEDELAVTEDELAETKAKLETAERKQRQTDSNLLHLAVQIDRLMEDRGWEMPDPPQVD